MLLEPRWLIGLQCDDFVLFTIEIVHTALKMMRLRINYAEDHGFNSCWALRFLVDNNDNDNNNYSNNDDDYDNNNDNKKLL